MDPSGAARHLTYGKEILLFAKRRDSGATTFIRGYSWCENLQVLFSGRGCVPQGIMSGSSILEL